jgi:hypothetical protein
MSRPSHPVIELLERLTAIMIATNVSSLENDYSISKRQMNRRSEYTRYQTWHRMTSYARYLLSG